MALKLTETDAPTPVRAPNPFDDVFPTREGKVITAVLPGIDTKGADTPEAKEIRKVIRQAREAANARDRSVKIGKTVAGTKAKPETILTFETRPKITRPRKPADEAAK